MPQPNVPVPGEPVILPPVDPSEPPLPGPDIPPLPEEEPGVEVPIEDPPYNPSFPDAPEIQPLIASARCSSKPGNCSPAVRSSTELRL
jgi:hypothetical protein